MAPSAETSGGGRQPAAPTPPPSTRVCTRSLHPLPTTHATPKCLACWQLSVSRQGCASDKHSNRGLAFDGAPRASRCLGLGPAKCYYDERQDGETLHPRYAQATGPWRTTSSRCHSPSRLRPRSRVALRRVSHMRTPLRRQRSPSRPTPQHRRQAVMQRVTGMSTRQPRTARLRML